MVARSAVLPEPLRSQLVAEGIVLLQEQLPGTITYHNLRFPGRRASWRREGTGGAVALTGRRRLVVATDSPDSRSPLGRIKHIDMPLDHPLRQAITITCDRPDQICFSYDANLIGPVYSGWIEVRLNTPSAPQIAQLTAL